MALPIQINISNVRTRECKSIVSNYIVNFDKTNFDRTFPNDMFLFIELFQTIMPNI